MCVNKCPDETNYRVEQADLGLFDLQVAIHGFIMGLICFLYA